MNLTSRLLAGALLLAAPAAFAQSTVTLAANAASASILKGLSVTNATAMSFGDIVTGTGSGTVVLATAGSRTTTGGAAGPSLIASGTAGAAAAFDVVGSGSRAFTVTLPADGVVTLTGPGSPMAVSAFTDDLVAHVGTLSGGTKTFKVGATLNVGATQTEGTYTGTYSVTVAYN